MTTKDGGAAFPMGVAFLNLQNNIANACSEQTDEFSANAGKALPASLEELGSVVSILYRLACCGWGCAGGDHTREWLTGKLVNQACGSYRLLRAGHYDESLILTRGVGEIANLLCLFKYDPPELSSWKAATRKERVNKFGPSAVRKKVEKFGITRSIDEERYQKLCEVGAHPVPGLAPGHYSANGRPILNGILQETGLFVCTTELGYAVSIAASFLAEPLAPTHEIKRLLLDKSITLMRSLGAFTLLNYEELNAEALRKNSTSH
jgi:hypothetical protein